jgi:hypothetical protein
MSGSPVYIGNRLLGSLSYRIGQFSKDPIAGITPIEQMLEVRDLPIEGSGVRDQGSELPKATGQGSAAIQKHRRDGMNFQAMETPLVMSGFRPKRSACGKSRWPAPAWRWWPPAAWVSSASSMNDPKPSAALATVVPGSAVSAQLVRGDLEIAATCTVTYVDPKQLLACGHPILQAGTGFAAHDHRRSGGHAGLAAQRLQDHQHRRADRRIHRGPRLRHPRRLRPEAAHDSRAHLRSLGGDRKLNVEVLDLPSLTPQAMLVSLYEALLETNRSTAGDQLPPDRAASISTATRLRLDEWASASDSFPRRIELACLRPASRFAAHLLRTAPPGRGALHRSPNRSHSPPRAGGARNRAPGLGDIVHAGDTVMVEATIRPWQQPARNVRIPVSLPARLAAAICGFWFRMPVRWTGLWISPAFTRPVDLEPCSRRTPQARRRPHLREPAGA